jgi:hypothetical protein
MSMVARTWLICLLWLMAAVPSIARVADVPGFSRRLGTEVLFPINGGSLTSVSRSGFDPEVEFLELGVNFAWNQWTNIGNAPGEQTWEVYGPDLEDRNGCWQ